MSIVVHGNNFVNLQQGQAVQNVISSSDDHINIYFNGRYFVSGQYWTYVRQLMENRHIIDPPVNQGINPSSWLNVWRHFTDNQEENVMCCTCNRRHAEVGGHVILENQGQNRVVGVGDNSVCIIPICKVCNGQNVNLNIRRDIRAVRIFDYYNSYGEVFVTEYEEHMLRITHIEISQQILQRIQDIIIGKYAHCGHIERQGRLGQEGQEGQQGRRGREQPQAGQARRPLYYNNPNARR